MRPRSIRILKSARHPFVFLGWCAYQRKRRDQNDYILATMNHSGTHWLRNMVARAIVYSHNLDYDAWDIKNFSIVPSYDNQWHRFKYNNIPEIPRIQHTHLPYNSFFFGDLSAVVLVRDLRDAVVSQYLSYSARYDQQMSFTRFLRGEGVHSWQQNMDRRIRFLNSWAKRRGEDEGILFVRFENLKSDTGALLEKTLWHLGLTSLTRYDVNSIVGACSIENMRKNESSTTNLSDRRHQKVRDGSSKKYASYFGEEDKRYFLNRVQNELEDWCGYDYNEW